MIRNIFQINRSSIYFNSTYDMSLLYLYVRITIIVEKNIINQSLISSFISMYSIPDCIAFSISNFCI